MRHAAFSALGVLLAVVVVASFPEPPPPRRPPPTENRLEEGAEKKNKAARKAWFEERHKAPPEVDWKSIERENGRAQLGKRNALGRRARSDGYAWLERGSVNQAGRMHVARPTADGGALVAGSSLGGVWKGGLDGTDWTPIGDNLYGGAHWLAVLPADEEGGPDVVLASTDWGFVHRSADDGVTWVVPEGLEPVGSVRRLVVSTDGAHTTWMVAGNGGTYKLYRSVDGARTFEVALNLGGFPGDVWLPRDGRGDVWVITRDQLLHSADGVEFGVVGDLPGGSDAAELVASEAGGPRFYAVRTAEGAPVLWKSDGGVAWEEVRALDDYWAALEASAVDPELFVWGGVEAHVTRDGGATVGIVNAWWDYYDQEATKLHADVMGIDVVPDGFGGELWYVSTDGGVYRSGDGLATVENLSLDGLRVSQYYGTHTSTADPTHVMAGAQDQGQQWTGDFEAAGDLFRFDQLISGDYAHLTSGDGSHALLYSVYPGFVLVSVGEEFEYYAYSDFPEGEAMAWLPPVLADPTAPETFFFASSHLYKYERNGAWDWRPTQWSEQDFGARDGEYLSGLAISPFDSDRMWAVTNYGRLFWSEDHGVTWAPSEGGGMWSQYFYGTALLASETDPDMVWVGGSGYGFPAVWRSTDGGRTFEEHSEGLPDTLVYALAEAPDGSGRVYAGTETAVYEWARGASSWRDVTGADAPVTIYWSAEALRHENTIRFGTYGRGIWDLQLDPLGLGCFPVVDRDGDGSPCDADCDDADGSVFPGAVEVCGDGLDADCDGEDPICLVPYVGGGCQGCATRGNPPSIVWLGLLATGFRGRRRLRT